MKKNFLMVASLLIAAMLLVVSCSQEVKAPESELVKTTIGIAYGKDVTVDYGEKAAQITYKYKLEPLWTDLTNGAPIYGATNEEVNVYRETKAIGDPLDPFSSNYVTPGYWQITVKGYVNSVAVLTGTTKAYFNNSNNAATVYVTPTNSSKGNLSIKLVMEDLDKSDTEDNSDSKVYYVLDGGTEQYLTKGNKVGEEGKNYAHEYLGDLTGANAITSGYHTITFGVKDYEGGVTKSFLIIPGNDVKIEGSIYPSKFKETQSSITVVSLGENKLTVAGREFKSSSVEPVVVTESSIEATIVAFEAPISVPDATKLGYQLPVGNNVTYTWYVDGVQNGKNTNTNSAIIKLPEKTTESGSVLIPGDYTISCIASYTFSDANRTEYTVYGNELVAGKVRVEASSNNKYQAPASNE